jgi:ParB family chromosome partitioning protein
LKPVNELGLFDSTDPARHADIALISVDKLHHYHNHPFKLYKGERLSEMVQSITVNGVIIPLIVRPLNDGGYEVLSGHNRLEASKLVGMEYVPCVVKEDLTYEEAYVYVTETNLMQRSFADLAHSERAAALAAHYEAIKGQGKRNDLVREIQGLTSPQIGARLKSSEKISEQFGLSKSNIERYIRLNGLLDGVKQLMDLGRIPVNAAYTLSFLDEVDQENIYQISTENEIKITMKQAEQLREIANDEGLNLEGIESVLLGNDEPKLSNIIKLKRNKLEQYFAVDTPDDAIEATIFKALRDYFEEE